MIVFELKCSHGHLFEGWFRDSAAFEQQKEADELSCPLCGDTEVTKAIMAPRVARRRDGRRDENAAQAQALKLLTKLRQQVEQQCDYVGERFPEEARRIHYGETEQRGIYGEASDAETKALAEEGIAVQRIPWLPRQDG